MRDIFQKDIDLFLEAECKICTYKNLVVGDGRGWRHSKSKQKRGPWWIPLIGNILALSGKSEGTFSQNSEF